MVRNLLAGIAIEPNIDLSVIVLNRGKLAAELQVLGIPVRVIDETSLSLPRIMSDVVAALNRHNPSIVHTHRYKENLIGYLGSRVLKGNTYLVGTQHGLPELHGHAGVIRQLVSMLNFRLLASKFQSVVAVSEDVRNALVRNHSLPEKSVRVIRNGVSIPQSAILGRPDSTFVIGSAGRFVPVKDYLLMVEIARRVRERNQQIRFELVGEGPMRQDISVAVTKANLGPAFCICEFCDEIATFHRGLNAYLNTSLHEGIPLSVLEAMAYGLPVIAPRVGGLSEIITDGEEGFLVDTRDPEHFVERCLQLHADPILWKRMSIAARERVTRDFSTQRMVRQYLNLYMEIEDDLRGAR